MNSFDLWRYEEFRIFRLNNFSVLAIVCIHLNIFSMRLIQIYLKLFCGFQKLNRIVYLIHCLCLHPFIQAQNMKANATKKLTTLYKLKKAFICSNDKWKYCEWSVFEWCGLTLWSNLSNETTEHVLHTPSENKSQFGIPKTFTYFLSLSLFCSQSLKFASENQIDALVM